MRRSVTIVRPGSKDRFGDQTSAGTEFTDSCLWVVGIPSSNDGSDGQRNDVSTRVTAYPLGETQVRAGDQVRISGRLYQVDGHPSRAESPFSGRLAGYVVDLKLFEG